MITKASRRAWLRRRVWGAGRIARGYQRWEAIAAILQAAAPVPIPRRAVKASRDIMRWSHTPAGLAVAGAHLVPERIAIVDDERSLTFADLDRRTNAIARAWRDAGVGPESAIGLLAQNRIAYLESLFAAQKTGAGVVHLNTSFAPPQVADVVATHAIDVLVHDRAMAHAASLAEAGMVIDEAALDAAAAGDTRAPPPPLDPGRVVVLTSGTTGRPKGAERNGGEAMDAASVLAAVPVVTGDTVVVAAPLFHSLGLFSANLGLALRSTIVLTPDFDAEGTLDLIARHRAAVLVVVPVMLRRILDLPTRVLDRYDTTSLRVVLSGGSQLPGELATRVMDRFGDVLYNVYGSTEVGLATVGGPRDLRAAPGCAGRPVPGVTVRIVDEHRRIVPSGTTGRIFVGSNLRMDGYVGGGGKETVSGLVATGDVGHFDRRGRLVVDGRDDDMVVSGGENVFPAEVEEALVRHPAVLEAVAFGVEDDEFGERLRAFVALRPGHEATPDDLRDHVGSLLARFKVPRDVVIVDALPRGATGKVLTRVLRESGHLPDDQPSDA